MRIVTRLVGLDDDIRLIRVKFTKMIWLVSELCIQHASLYGVLNYLDELSLMRCAILCVMVLTKIDKQIHLNPIIRELEIETCLSQATVPAFLYICTGNIHVSQTF